MELNHLKLVYMSQHNLFPMDHCPTIHRSQFHRTWTFTVFETSILNTYH